MSQADGHATPAESDSSGAGDADTDIDHLDPDVDTSLADVTLDDAETARVNHLVPEPLRDAAQERTDHGELSERVRALYRIVATGGVADSRGQLKMELEQVRAKKDGIRAEIDSLQAQLRGLERQEQRLADRIDDQQSRKDRYLGHLESLEQRIRDGMNAPPEHGAVQQAADTAGKTPAAVIEDVQERNPDLPDRAFTRHDQLAPHETWHGTAGGGGDA